MKSFKPYYRKYQGGWVGALIQAGGALAGGMLSKSGQSSANSMSNKMALRQMMFQKQMATHAHQYEVADLRAAGLNPVLSGTGGSGAATPSGASSTYENEKGAGVSSALDALAKITTALVNKTQADNLKAQTENTQARTTTEREQPGLIRQQVSSAKASQANTEADTRIKGIGYDIALSELDKNYQMTNLLHEQGLTQEETTKLMKINVAQAAQVLKGMMIEGHIDETKYGEIIRYISRLLPMASTAAKFAP